MFFGEFGDDGVSVSISTDSGSGGTIDSLTWFTDPVVQFMMVNETVALKDANATIKQIVDATTRSFTNTGYKGKGTNAIIPSAQAVGHAIAYNRYPSVSQFDSINRDAFFYSIYPAILDAASKVAATQFSVVKGPAFTVKQPVVKQQSAPRQAAPVTSSGIPTWAYIVGGVVLLGGVGFVVYKKKYAK